MKKDSGGNILKGIFSLWKFGLIEGIIIYFLFIIGCIPIIAVFFLFALVIRFLFTSPPNHIEIYFVIILNLLGIIWVPIVFGFIINKRFKSWSKKNKDIIEAK